MTIEELRVLITARTEGLQEGIARATSGLNRFRSTSNDTSATMGQSVRSMERNLSSLNASFEKTQVKISETRAKLAELYAKQDEIKQIYSALPTLTGMSQDESMDQMLGSDSNYQNLANEVTALEENLQRLIVTGEVTSNTMTGLEGSISQAGNTISNASNNVQQATNSITNHVAKSTNKIAGFANMISKSFVRVLKRIFILNLIYKLIRGLINYINGGLKTNSQFASSLQTIGTNLRVAFQPIYDFILPAINALMRGLATLTSYMASFTSALFGKTYKQSYDAAKGIETAKKAMDGYGSSAKKAKGQLAGFDEINPLNTDEDSGGSKDFEMEVPDLTQIDEGPIARLQKLLAEMFKPFQDTWNNEGQNTINAAKGTLNSVKELIIAIGASFKEVWTNGSGQQILETLLRILQNIFELMGRIAESFRIAWAENETGTKIIQGIADIWIILLGIIESVGESLNKVWGEIGQGVANTFMGILLATVEVLRTLAEGLRTIWDNGGQHLFESLVKLGAKIFELAGQIYTEFVAPFLEWFVELISPAIGEVLDWVANLVDGFVKLIDWLLEDGNPTLEILVTVLGSIALAIGIVKGAMLAWNVITTVWTAISWLATYGTTALGLAFLAIDWPIVLITAAIAAVIAIGILLYRHWDEIGPWLKDMWEGIKTKAEEIWNGIKDFFVKSWDATKNKVGEVWNAIKNFLIEKIWNPIKDTAKTIWEGIKKYVIDPIEQSWIKLKEIWDKIKKYILDKWDEIKTGISNTKDKLVNAIKEPFNIAKDWIDGIVKDAFNWGKNLIGNIVDGISSMIGKVKDAVSKVGDSIGDFLGFHSPSKKGAGRDADRWMPNLMNMLADGIKDNIYKVSGAVDVTANALQGIERTNNTNAIASAIGSAIMAANQFNSGNKQEGDILVNIDGKTLARIVKPYLDNEYKRIGTDITLNPI